MQQRIGHIIFFIGFCLISGSHALAQEGETIKIISHRSSDKILLRWAPTNASLWKSANSKGYILERFTILRDSNRVYPPPKLKLANELKPAKIEDWELAAESNSYAAIIAQAIYGNSFQLDLPQDANGIISAIKLSQDQQARYSYSLLAADLSFDLAKMAGLGFEDSTIHEDEAYLYKIYTYSGLQKADTGYIFVPVAYSPPLPAIKELVGEFKDKSVNLTWSIRHMQAYYTTYIIEKSSDGKNYKRLDEPATITAQTETNSDPNYMIRSDSLPDNQHKYYYRVRGVSPFGVLGPPSESVVGQGQKSSGLEVFINKAESGSEGIGVFWKYNKDTAWMTKIEETVLSRSTDSKRFIPIFSASGFVDYYLDSIPGSANYYQVELKDETGNKYKSLPYMVIMEDSIPPALPLGVVGECDSLGVIKLGWHPNSESDLAGYRVYRSIIGDGEYRQITSSPSTQAVFYDTVNLKSLTRDIYYSIEAVDLRGNRSSKSLPVKVRVYDLVPPTPPRILGFTTDANRVSIKWTESSSDDVDSYLLHKTSDNDKEARIKVFRSSDGVTNILFDSVEVAGRLEYYLTAVDSNNNESAKSNAILVNLENSKSEQSILAVKVDRNKNLIVLSWTMPFYASQIRLYRAAGDNPLSLYKSLSGDREAFVDSSLTINAEYTYVLQFIDIDSRKSSFSNELKVLF